MAVLLAQITVDDVRYYIAIHADHWKINEHLGNLEHRLVSLGFYGPPADLARNP